MINKKQVLRACGAQHDKRACSPGGGLEGEKRRTAPPLSPFFVLKQPSVVILSGARGTRAQRRTCLIILDQRSVFPLHTHTDRHHGRTRNIATSDARKADPRFEQNTRLVGRQGYLDAKAATEHHA